MKTGEVLARQVALKQLQDEDEERAAKKKTEAKKARKLLMKEVENKERTTKNDEYNVSGKERRPGLGDNNGTVSSFCNRL